jgi:hypothetical protein
MIQDLFLLPIDGLFVGGWILPAISIGAGLLQGLSSSRSANRQDRTARDMERRRLEEDRRQFDASHRLNQDRYGLDQRQVALQEGIDQRRSSGLAATAGNRQRLIENLMRRLLSGATGSSL